MAEVHGSMQGPNGEQLKLNLKEKSISLVSGQLLPILLMAGLLVFVYLRDKNVSASIAQLLSGQHTIITTVQDAQRQLQATQQQRDAHQDVQMQDLHDIIRDMLRQLWGALTRINHNLMQPPEEQLPLEPAPPQERPGGQR